MASDGQDGIAEYAPLAESGAGGHAPATPHVIVLFGATGDLARRKLLPGLFHLSRAGLLPDCRIVATSLEELDDARVPRRGPFGLRRVRPRRGDRGALAPSSRRRISYVPGTHGPDGLAEAVEHAESTLERRATSAALPEHPSPRRRRRGADPRRGRARPTGPGSSWRSRSAPTCHSARTPQRRGPRGLRRRPGLPHRPLPGQGGRPEHPGLPVRQRPVRAHLEPRAHRPRPDRRARDPRRSGRGPPSTSRPGPSGTWSSPTSSRSWPSWPWSRRPPSSRGPSTRRRTRSSVRCGPSTRPTWCGASTRGTAGADGVAPDSDTETFVALRCEIDNWRWAGVPFFLRTGKQMAEGARIVSIAFREPPKSMFPPGSGVGTQGPDHLTFDLADSSQAVALLLRQAPGPGHEARQAEPAVRPARDRARRRRPRGLRAADPRRHVRRPDPVHQRRGHRAPVGGVPPAARGSPRGPALPGRVLGAVGHHTT